MSPTPEGQAYRVLGGDGDCHVHVPVSANRGDITVNKNNAHWAPGKFDQSTWRPVCSILGGDTIALLRQNSWDFAKDIALLPI